MSETANDWYRERLRAASAGDATAFHKAFALIPRKFDAKAGERQRRLCDVYRSDLLLAFLGSAHPDAREIVETLFRTATVDEAVLLYRNLPWFPDPESWTGRAITGVRSDLGVVFRAVALHNSFPRGHFSEPEWNQLVLKAAFLAEPLEAIDGLDARANPELGRMLKDFISEREAAGRPVADDVRRHAVACSV